MDSLGETSPTPPAPTPTGRLAQLERLVDHLRKVLSHDLSNQLVAVRGLLQVLQLDEGPSLGVDGQNYLRRADAAAQRAQALVAGLKELAALAAERAAAEPLALDELIREVAAEGRALSSPCTVEVALDPAAARLRAPRRLLHQALMALVRLLPLAGEGPRRIGICSRRTPSGIECSLASPPEAAGPPRPARVDPEAGGFFAQACERLDWAVARELAHECGGTLAAWSEPGRGVLFTLTLSVISGPRPAAGGQPTASPEEPPTG